MINAYKIVTGKPQGRYTLGDPGISGKFKLKNSTRDLPCAPDKQMARVSAFIII
jgi:hypothetical protein